MRKNQGPVIKTREDANLHLALAKELHPVLPIDIEIDRLDKKRILNGDDDGKRAARHAVFEAASWAFNKPLEEQELQDNRKATPKYFRELQKRVNTILENYEEIHSSLSNHQSAVALHYIENAVTSKFPQDKRQAVKKEFHAAFVEFCSFQATLHNFQQLLSLGAELVGPKVGRPTEATYHFVNRLAVEWFKLTGKEPTRAYDALQEKEAGDFYRFCMAAASTVEAVVSLGSLDAAVRRVCKEWRVNQSRDDYVR